MGFQCVCWILKKVAAKQIVRLKASVASPDSARAFPLGYERWMYAQTPRLCILITLGMVNTVFRRILLSSLDLKLECTL